MTYFVPRPSVHVGLGTRLLHDYPSHANSKNAVVVDYLGQAKLRSCSGVLRPG